MSPVEFVLAFLVLFLATCVVFGVLAVPVAAARATAKRIKHIYAERGGSA